MNEHAAQVTTYTALSPQEQFIESDGGLQQEPWHGAKKFGATTVLPQLLTRAQGKAR
jgi:hypothetical protein